VPDPRPAVRRLAGAGPHQHSETGSCLPPPSRRIHDRRLLISAAAATLAAVALPPVTAHAYPYCDSGYNCDYVWFADAAHTQPVGWKLVECDGSSFFDGRQTSFLEYHLTRCPGF
jgi:hypothetical protein